jgi:hypothetical protein
MRRTLLLWSILAALYVGFRFWYDGGGGPISPAEAERYVAALEARGASAERVAGVRDFLASDTGDDFVMANFIHFQPDEDARAKMDRYMAHMYPALFRRACHPVLAGPVVARALDLWGVDGAAQWSMVGLVRYRSRRDVMEIATDPAFGGAHEFKVAAMAQTIAVPVETDVWLGSPRWLVGGALLTLGALLQLALARRSS